MTKWGHAFVPRLCKVIACCVSSILLRYLPSIAIPRVADLCSPYLRPAEIMSDAMACVSLFHCRLCMPKVLKPVVCIARSWRFMYRCFYLPSVEPRPILSNGTRAFLHWVGRRNQWCQFRHDRQFAAKWQSLLLQCSPVTVGCFLVLGSWTVGVLVHFECWYSFAQLVPVVFF